MGIMQASLEQDKTKSLRIVTIDIKTGNTHEYAYQLTDGSASKHSLPVMTEKTTKIGTTKKVQDEASGGRSFNPFRRSFDRLKSMRGSL